MNSNDFAAVIEGQFEKCRQVLGAKAEEYASDVDRLHNFKQAASLRKTDNTSALSGMMVKHIISLFDMMEAKRSYPEALWSEKITDTINYCLLLQALLVENGQMSSPNPLPLQVFQLVEDPTPND